MNFIKLQSNVKSKFIKIYRGQLILNMLTKLYDSLSLPSWILSSKAKKSREKLLKIKNQYQGKRCFIIGNGPSLKKMDLSLIKEEFTFGLNRIYLLFSELGFQTTFLICTNKLVISQCNKDFNRFSMQKFFSWKANSFLSFDDQTIFFRPITEQKFAKDFNKGVWEGTTVTFVAIQLAYYLGFSKVILIGVDHNFQTEGSPHQIIISRNNDQNHFSPHYFGPGFKWNFPDLNTSEYAYLIAKKAYEKDNREIIDATINGKLTIFPKVKYNSLFKGGTFQK